MDVLIVVIFLIDIVMWWIGVWFDFVVCCIIIVIVLVLIFIKGFMDVV